jgi:putative heme-binding domain-containing protein
LPIAPGPLQSTIAVGLSGRRPGADRFLDAVTAGKASARLLQERPVQVQLNQAGIPDLSARLATILKDLPPAEQAIQALIRGRRDGFASATADAGSGKKVFAKNCAGCHQIGGEGARVGPQLDGIGVRGADRLLEDILDPNRNVDQAFRTTQIATKDGQVVSGLLLREEGSILVLADATGKDVRVPVDSVEERKVAQVSPMPANMAEQIPERDFYDLIAFLLSQDERKPSK